MISIILPTYNSLGFLEARVNTILNQTSEDWECIVIDGFSSDGTWQYLKKIELENSRFRLYQYPPLGVYNAWNIGISKAKGDYLYIATSDDTMMPNFLEKMVKALEVNESCDLAHCCLIIIDERGAPTENQWKDWLKVQHLGDSVNYCHIRKAPLDGIRHLFFNTVYSSITQLLIRRNLFDKIGLFSEGYGEIADFEWGLKAGLHADVLHVPEYLATWRKHGNQATKGGDYFLSSSFFSRLIEMSRDALHSYDLPSSERYKVSLNSCLFNYRQGLFLSYLIEGNKLQALIIFLMMLRGEPKDTLLMLKEMVLKRPKYWMEIYNPNANLDRLLDKMKLRQIDLVKIIDARSF